MKESTVPRMNPSLSRGISKIGSMVDPDLGKRGSMATFTRNTCSTGSREERR